jgi:hypothetical protein
MTDIIVKITIEVLSILAIATKEIEQGRASELFFGDILLLFLGYATLEKYLNKLVGRRDVEDALGRLDKLTQDEVRMVAAQVLKTAHGVDDRVVAVDGKVQGVSSQVQATYERVNAILESAHVVFDVLWISS